MKHFRMFIGLFVFWMVLCDGFTIRQVVSGLAASFFTILIYRWLMGHANMEYPKGIGLWQIFRYMGVVLVEIFRSAFEHMLRILSGKGDTEIISIHLETKTEIEAALIANAITLTPGSVTVELNQKQLKILTYKDDPQSPHVNKTHHYVARLQKIFK